jgi:pseudaminic acid cytidylyltransferase
MIVAVIPARGGSKRIPHKNIKNFLGKPIIAWSIETAIKSGIFDKVIVSTDDDEIAAVAKEYGAEVPFIRPAELSDDNTGTSPVVKHAIRWLQSNGHEVEYACCIYATAPFVQSKYLLEGFSKLKEFNKAYAFSVTSFPFPIQRALRIVNDNQVEAIWPENTNSRSQDLEEAYHDAGQFYWGRADAFLSDVVLYSEESVPIVLPRFLVQDIDTYEDWQRAELMFDALVKSGEICH